MLNRRPRGGNKVGADRYGRDDSSKQKPDRWKTGLLLVVSCAVVSVMIAALVWNASHVVQIPLDGVGRSASGSMPSANNVGTDSPAEPSDDVPGRTEEYSGAADLPPRRVRDSDSVSSQGFEDTFDKDVGSIELEEAALKSALAMYASTKPENISIFVVDTEADYSALSKSEVKVDVRASSAQDCANKCKAKALPSWSFNYRTSRCRLMRRILGMARSLTSVSGTTNSKERSTAMAEMNEALDASKQLSAVKRLCKMEVDGHVSYLGAEMNDMTGQARQVAVVSSALKCCDMCSRRTMCAAWVYSGDTRECSMKSTIGDTAFMKAFAISGVTNTMLTMKASAWSHWEERKLNDRYTFSTFLQEQADGYKKTDRPQLFATLWTLPERIHQIQATIASIKAQRVVWDKIIVVIPSKTVVPSFLSNDKIIRIVTVDKCGSVSALVGAALDVATHPQDVIITFEDNKLYYPGVAANLVKFSSEWPDSVIAHAGYGLKQGPVSITNINYQTNPTEEIQVDVVTAELGVLYRKKFFDESLRKDLVDRTYLDAEHAGDEYISGKLGLSGITKVAVTRKMDQSPMTIMGMTSLKDFERMHQQSEETLRQHRKLRVLVQFANKGAFGVRDPQSLPEMGNRATRALPAAKVPKIITTQNACNDFMELFNMAFTNGVQLVVYAAPQVADTSDCCSKCAKDMACEAFEYSVAANHRCVLKTFSKQARNGSLSSSKTFADVELTAGVASGYKAEAVSLRDSRE